jgi:glycosyltransferase involved in cell wall biosynthesis
MVVSIIIPVYNEASTVADLLERVRRQILPGIRKEIVIVESNSTDGSRELVDAFCATYAADRHVSIVLIRESRAHGKGHAVRAGIAAATGEILLIQDADLEYDVGDYPELLAPIICGRAAFVLGSRHLGADDWKIRRFAHGGALAAGLNLAALLFHGLFNALYGTRLTDPTSMYKVFRADCLEGIELTCNRFDFDFELLGKLVRAGYPPLEVPVSYESRGFEAGKKIRLFRDPPTWIAAMLKSRFARRSKRVAGPPGVLMKHPHRLEGVLRQVASDRCELVEDLAGQSDRVTSGAIRLENVVELPRARPD